MKQVTGTKQKWILSLALLAVLSSQSYFQVNSNSLESIDLASRSVAAEAAEVKKADAAAAKPAEVADVKKEDDRITALEKKIDELTAITKKMQTEGKASVLGCTDNSCSTTAMKPIAEKIVVAKKEEKETEEDKEETPKERRERIKKEKEEKKKLALKEKKEKEKEAKAAVNEEFTEKMNAISEECSGQSIQCAGSKMVEILKEYSGSDVVKPDSFVINKAYYKNFSTAFQTAVLDPASQQDVLAVLAELNAELPAEYRNLKERTSELVTRAATIKASQISTNFVNAEMLRKANKPTEALNLQMDGMRQRDQLQLSSQLMTSAMVDGLTSVNDQTTLSYLQATYLPSLNKILTGLLDTSSTSLTSNINGSSNGSRSNGGRGGLNGINQQLGNNQNILNNSGLLNTNSTNMTIGQPTSQSRGSRTGLNFQQ